MSLDLIPKQVAKFIAGSRVWRDGDTWVIGNGRVVEYEYETNLFSIYDRRSNTRLGVVSFQDVMDKGRDR
jgi:hypothetical protein